MGLEIDLIFNRYYFLLCERSKKFQKTRSPIFSKNQLLNSSGKKEEFIVLSHSFEEKL